MKPTVPRMRDDEARAWLALVNSSQLLPVALDAQLQEQAGLTHFEFMVLGALNVASEQTLRTSELAAEVYATLPRLSKVITRMVQRELVERVACAEDGRATNVVLTRDGRKALLMALPGHLDFVRGAVLDGLTPQQLTALADALEPVVTRLTVDERFPWARESSVPTS